MTTPYQPSPSEPSIPLSCPRCGQKIDTTDRYCRRCGAPLFASNKPTLFPPPPPTGTGIPWYYQPLWILMLGLFVLGPFVLPLILKSPAMDRRTKIWLSAIIIVYTTLLLYWTGLLVLRIRNEFNEVMQELEGM